MSVHMLLYLLCVQMIKFAVKVAEWPPFEEELPSLFAVCVLFVICRPTFVFELFPFFLSGRVWF